MALSPVNGCKLYIGAPLDEKSTDFVVGDFSGLAYTEITGWTEFGTVGDMSALITESIIGEGRDKKSKGTRNAGSMQNVFVIRDADPGQVALRAAEKSGANYAFKLEGNDKPVIGASPKNSLRYFVGLVMGVQEAGGSANTNRKLNTTLEINSNVVPVAASAT